MTKYNDFDQDKDTKLSLDEQETHINFSAGDVYCELYTSHYVWMRKIKKKVEENPKEFIIIKETPYYIRVKFPLKYLKIRTKSRSLTEEQRAAASERFKKYHENKSK